MNWTSMQIRDVCEVFDGPHATPPKSDEGPIYLGITSLLANGGIDFEGSKRISAEDFPRWTKRVTPRKNDVVFSYEATLGRYAIIPEGFIGCLGRRMAIMRPKTDILNPRFLFYYMYSNRWKEVIASKTILGATVNRIPIAQFPSFPILIPPIHDQERIADTLSAYDKLIENNRKQIKLLEEPRSASTRNGSSISNSPATNPPPSTPPPTSLKVGRCLPLQISVTLLEVEHLQHNVQFIMKTGIYPGQRQRT